MGNPFIQAYMEALRQNSPEEYKFLGKILVPVGIVLGIVAIPLTTWLSNH
jgi:hypothetical protein